MGEGGTHPWRVFKRRPRLRKDWEPPLNAWLEAAIARARRYGHHDCLLSVAGAVEAQTGRDFAEGHRGRYRTRAGAARYIRRLGFTSAEALLDSILDAVPAAFAQRGDIVLMEGVPGICIGGEALFFDPDAAGVVRAARSAWAKAWAVGRGVPR